jgi:hypothetical protein
MNVCQLAAAAADPSSASDSDSDSDATPAQLAKAASDSEVYTSENTSESELEESCLPPAKRKAVKKAAAVAQVICPISFFSVST